MVITLCLSPYGELYLMLLHSDKNHVPTVLFTLFLHPFFPFSFTPILSP